MTTAALIPTPAYAFSATTTVTAGLPPATAPSNPTRGVSTLLDPDTAFVHWADLSGDEDGFDLYRSTDPAFQAGVTLVARTAADANQYADPLPDETEMFYYRAYAYKDPRAAGTTDDSNDGVEGQTAYPADQPAGPAATPPTANESTYSANADQGGLALRSVQFGGVSATTQVMTSIYQASRIQTITQDNGTPYPSNAPQWLDANADGTIAGGPSTYLDQTIVGTTEHQWPLSYERSRGSVPAAGDPNESKSSASWAFMAATPTFAFAGQETGTWEVEGLTDVQGMLASVSGTKDVNKVITFGPGVLHQQGATLTAYAVANQPLPNTIQSELMKITWQVSFDHGQTWVTLKVGTSRNWLYVTGGPATGAFQTVLYVGCQAAAGLAPSDGPITFVRPGYSHEDGNDEAVTFAVFAPFEGCAIRSVDNHLLAYLHDGQSYFTTADLLENHKGRCGAWARFFVDTLDAQGVASEVVRVDPLDITPVPQRLAGYTLNGKVLQVRSTPAQGSLGLPYGKTVFDDHALVWVPSVPTCLFDPSYGKCYFANTLEGAMQSWEDLNLVSIGNTFINSKKQTDSTYRLHQTGGNDVRFNF